MRKVYKAWTDDKELMKLLEFSWKVFRRPANYVLGHYFSDSEWAAFKVSNIWAGQVLRIICEENLQLKQHKVIKTSNCRFQQGFSYT